MSWRPCPSLERMRNPAEPRDVSVLCGACQTLFNDTGKRFGLHRHFRLLKTLRNARDRGCHLCTLVFHSISQNTPADRLHSDLYLLYEKVNRDLWVQYREWESHGCDSRREDVVLVLLQGKFPIELSSASGLVKSSLADTISLALFLAASCTALQTKDAGSSTGSNQSRRMATAWFKQCTTSHKRCNQHTGIRHWVPARLIQICTPGDKDDAMVKLITKKQLRRGGKYAALSHCWGTGIPTRLLQSNMQQMIHGVPLKCLPKTFRDAIEVARQWLGLHYIWIDSLCIIQDPEEDWQLQCSTMRQIYQNATCTIAATGASDSSGGLFHDRDLTSACPVVVNLKFAGMSTKRYILDSQVWLRGIGASPLLKRAWVLQERWLSHRILHFTSNLLWYECCEADFCEALGEWPLAPYGSVSYERLFADMSFLKQSGPRQRSHLRRNHRSLLGYPHRPPRREDLVYLWDSLLTTYSNCRLTRESDKLMALAGVADEFRLALDDRYVAGHWESCLGEQLVWSIAQQMGEVLPEPSTYRAPSWSCLSVDAEINASPRDLPASHIQILRVDIDLMNPENPTGPIKHAEIKLQGVLIEADRHDSSKGHLRNKKHGPFELNFDRGPWEMYAQCPVSYLPVSYGLLGLSIYGLVLECTGETEKGQAHGTDKTKRRFRRLGSFYAPLRSEDLDRELLAADKELIYLI